MLRFPVQHHPRTKKDVDDFFSQPQRTAENRREWQNPKTHKLMKIGCLFGERPHCCESPFDIIQEQKGTLTSFSLDRLDRRDHIVFLRVLCVLRVSAVRSDFQFFPEQPLSRAVMWEDAGAEKRVEGGGPSRV